MLALWLFHLRRALRPSRRRRIADMMAEFAAINPALHNDIGLRPGGFRDAAQELVDARLAEEAAEDAATLARLRGEAVRRPATCQMS